MSKQDVSALRDSIKAITANLEPLKAAVAEQRAIIVNYRKLIKDIERGVVNGKHGYTVDGLTHGIEQAELHIIGLVRVRDQERERIKDYQQMIHDIERAAELKKEALEHVVLELVKDADTEDHGDN